MATLLTDQERALPEDYDKNNASLLATQGTQFKTVPHIHDGDGSTEWVIKDVHAEEKVMNTPGYPARLPKPRRPDLYEVKMTLDMGQGVFAKHDIKRGELIFSERPLLVAPNWLALANPNIHYTLDQNRQIMMFAKEKLLEVGVQRMNENDKALYMALHNSHTTDGSGPLLGIMRTNAFAASELSDNSNSPLHYSAICSLGSRLNHSCMPNVNASFKIPSFSFQFFAAREIKAGEQLCCAYIDLARTKAERQNDLAPYGFSCRCLACVNATPASDNLRKTFKDQVSRLDAKRNQPGLMAGVVASAKLLEAEMVTEGLDNGFEFFSLLLVIFLSCNKLGRRAETTKYQDRVKEYCKIHVHDKPSLLPFLTL